MHAHAVEGNVQMPLQALAQIVGGQNRVFRSSGKTLAPQTQNVGVGFENDAEVAVEGRDVPDGFGVAVIEAVQSVLLLHHPRHGQIIRQT